MTNCHALLQFLLAVLLQAMTTEPSVDVDLRVTSTKVTKGVTKNVTVTCLVNCWDDEGYYDVRGTCKVTQLRMQRLSTGFSSGLNANSWTIVDKISDADLHSNAHSSEDHILSSRGINENGTSFLSLTWTIASENTIGTFACDAEVENSDGSIQVSMSPAIQIENNLREVIDRLLQTQKTEILNQVRKDLSALNELVKMLPADVKQTLAAHDKRLEELENKMQAPLPGWPTGSYALLETRTGCPVDNWQKGFIRHHSESSSKWNDDAVSESSHLQTPVLSEDGTDHFVTQHFCVQVSSTPLGPAWPKGSYCINKKGPCPPGFQKGYIVLDEEDDGARGSSSGVLPDGEVRTSRSRIDYCCRDDGFARDEISLPTSRPFYLYRRGGLCQRVQAMNVTAEFLYIDTEDNRTGDIASGAVPDSEIDNVKLELCYYQPA